MGRRGRPSTGARCAAPGSTGRPIPEAWRGPPQPTQIEILGVPENAGFEIAAEESLRGFAMDYFREVFAKTAQASGPPRLGLHRLTGHSTSEKFGNYVRALEAHQIDPIIVVATRV